MRAVQASVRSRAQQVKSSLLEEHPDRVRIARLVRYELASYWAQLAGSLSRRRCRARADWQHATGLRLNIAGGGVRKDGWLAIDALASADIRMDLRRRIPLPDGSASLIFCEHFCDHVAFPHVISRFLSECHRLLEPAGTARFVLHDARQLVEAYLNDDIEYFDTAGERLCTLMESVNKLFRFNDFHQFLYDFETFEIYLRRAGFRQVTRMEYNRSSVPGLALDFQHPSREVMSMYVEARR